MVPRSVFNIAQSARLAVGAALVGLASGAASAAFLFTLDQTVQVWKSRPWLIAALPIVGAVVALTYRRFGGRAVAGVELVLREARKPETHLPFRLAPFVWLGTLATHLCGGSVGREGTAVQVSAALADQLVRFKVLPWETRRSILVAGLAAGFGSVFGVPWAGAVFGLEACGFRRAGAKGAAAAIIASFVAHATALRCGVVHSIYAIGPIPEFSFVIMARVVAASLAFGLAARVFLGCIRSVERVGARISSRSEVRAAIFGTLFVCVVWMFELSRPLGLGLGPLAESFSTAAPVSDFAWKIALSALLLGAGFKGGEATPLFFIGATLGSAISGFVGLPLGLAAGLGLAATFGAAGKVPWAAAILACELFGWHVAPVALIASVASQWTSGRAGVYGARAHLVSVSERPRA